MIQIDLTCSPIQRILKENIHKAKHSKDFNKFISNEVLSLTVVDRKDKNMAYVTDGYHTIFTILVQKQQEIHYYPLNRLQTKHYTYEPKIFAYLNFTKTTQPPTPQQLHPYNPHYFFKQDYSDFIIFRETYKMKQPSQNMTITEWNLAIVNINSTGYYAPILVVRKFKKENTYNLPNYLSLNCILYEEWLKNYMEAYRIEDMRNQYQKRFPSTINISLFYFLRLKRNVAPKNCSLVAIDQNKNLLKYAEQLPKHYILIGNLKGTVSFVNATKGEINEQDIERKKLKDVQLLFNGLNIEQTQIKKELTNKNIVWSDSDQDDDRCYEREETRTVANAIQESQSEEEDGDILKNIYIKSLQMKGHEAI